MKPAASRVIFAFLLFTLDLAIAPSLVSGALASDCSSPAVSASGAPLENEAFERRSDAPFKPSGAYFVSPRGRDRWSGRIADPMHDVSEGPFATLDRVLSARRNAAAKQDATVFAWGNHAAGIGPYFTVSVDGMPIGNAYPGRVDEMRGNTIAGNTVHAAAPDVMLSRSNSGGRPLLTDNAYVEPGGTRGMASGAAGPAVRRTGPPIVRRN